VPEFQGLRNLLEKSDAHSRTTRVQFEYFLVLKT
jgi:hypothetical protein